MGKSQPNPATCLAALSLSIVYSFSHSVSRSFIDGWWRGDDTAEPIGSRQCKVRYNQIKRKAFGTFGLDRNGWDHDPLIRAVIKNRGKSFSRRTSLALWSRNLWSSSDKRALYIYGYGLWLKKSDFPRWQQFIVYLIHTVMASAPLFDFMLLRGDILAMCIIIIIIVSLSTIVPYALHAARRRGAVCECEGNPK